MSLAWYMRVSFWNFGIFLTSILVLWRQKLKYVLVSNHLFQTTQEHGGWEKQQSSDKTLYFSCHIENSNLSKLVVTITHTEERFFSVAILWRFVSRFFSDRIEKLLVCMSFLWIYREEKTKQILLMRSKFIFLYLDSLICQTVNLSWK